MKDSRDPLEYATTPAAGTLASAGLASAEEEEEEAMAVDGE